jgi:hypothetical protein
MTAASATSGCCNSNDSNSAGGTKPFASQLDNRTENITSTANLESPTRPSKKGNYTLQGRTRLIFDQFFSPVYNREVSILVPYGNVASLEPSIRRDGRSRRSGIIQVSLT